MAASGCGGLRLLGGHWVARRNGGRGGLHGGLGHHQLLDDVSGIAKAVG